MSTLRFWLPAMAGMTCLGLGAGLMSIFGFFVPPLSREFGVGVAVLNTAPVALLLVPGLLAPFVGRLADNWSIKRLILLGTALSMSSLFLLSQAPTLGLMAVAFCGFALGQVCYGPVVINALMVKLYPAREGRALAIASMGISVASITLPVFVGAMLAVLDWRNSLSLLSLAMLTLLWLWVFSGIPTDAKGVAAPGSRGPGRDIYRRTEFWLVGVVVALALSVSIILAICYPPLFANRGFSAVEAGLFLSVAGAAGMCGKLLLAGFADAAHRHTLWIAAFLLLVKLLGLLLLVDAQSSERLTVALALLGFSGGAFIPMAPYLNSRFFSAGIIGQVNGAQMPLFLPLGLSGPPLAGYVYDQTGSYQLVVQCLAVLPVVALGLLLLLPRQAR